jgi:16S rRNA processing protein RimM
MFAVGLRDSGEMSEAKRILLGAIAGAHGVRGQVKVKAFTAEPDAIADYGPLEDETGARRFELSITGHSRGLLIAHIAEVEDREAAEALKGTQLYVPRTALPETQDDDEFYQTDLIGLAVAGPDGATVGLVKAVQDFGAGDLLEIERPDAVTVYVPFTLEAVPVIDLEAGRIVLAHPLSDLTVD